MENNSEEKRTITELVIAAVLTALMTLSVFNLLSSTGKNQIDQSISNVKIEKAEPGELP